MSILGNPHQIDIMTEHPCFNNKIHSFVGRVHLPVARLCNIQCNYCEHNTCATLKIQHPGWTARLLSVPKAVHLIRSIMRQRQSGYFFVVGIAGPGDPLANRHTFEALHLIHKEYPHLLKCMSTNGLLLQDKLGDLVRVGVKALTITINAVDSQVGRNIYSKVRYNGTMYREEEAAGLLIAKQFIGIEQAVDAGLSVKVNTVLIPGINDGQMPSLATRIKKAGAKIMNIMPLIPSGKMRNIPAPSCDELRKTRLECEKIIPQFRHCEQCRADLMYLPDAPARSS